MSYIVATDVGGTCTDTVIASDDGHIEIGKVLSTPPAFANGVVDSVRTTAAAMGLTLEALLADTRLFVHGSTVVDNILLTHSGTPTALLTTAGFEDTLRVTRGAYGRWARRHHLHHHFASPKKNHGVTSPLWDWVFRTYAAPRPQLKIPPKQVMAWLLDEEGAVKPPYQDDYVLIRPAR